MQRRTFPTILLYGFGLALMLSLVFNGFLLYKQSRQRSTYEYDLSRSVDESNYISRQGQVSDCTRAGHPKDSRIDSPTDSPGKAFTNAPAKRN